MAFRKIKEAFSIVGIGVLFFLLIVIAAVGWLFLFF